MNVSESEIFRAYKGLQSAVYKKTPAAKRGMQIDFDCIPPTPSHPPGQLNGEDLLEEQAIGISLFVL